MKQDSCKIYYQSWQLQCCGKPFKVGDRVRWSCALPDDGRRICGHIIDFIEEHHSDETHTIVGTIVDIWAVTQADTPEKRCYELDDSKVSLTNLLAADGYESEKEATTETYYIFWGYIVTMKDVEVMDYDEHLKYDYD